MRRETPCHPPGQGPHTADFPRRRNISARSAGYNRQNTGCPEGAPQAPACAFPWLQKP